MNPNYRGHNYNLRQRGGGRGRGGRGRGRGRYTGTYNKPHGGSDAISSVVVIQGFPATSDHRQLVNFLKEKAAGPFHYLEYRLDHPKLFLSFASSHEAQILLRLNGIRYHKHKLTIQELRTQHQQPPTQGKLKGPFVRALEAVVGTNYNTQTKTLDFNHLSDVINKGQPRTGGHRKGGQRHFNIDWSNNKFTQALGQLCPDVVTIDLSSNNISTLGFLEGMRQFIPACINLCFNDNQISDVQALHVLRMVPLRELLLTNNPVSRQAPEAQYQETISSILPSLKFLDGKPIGQQVFLSQNPHISQFVEKYFAEFDSNRMNVVPLYSAQSRFSVVVNADSQPPPTPPLMQQTWNQYVAVSRNNAQIPPAVGPEQIAQVFMRLPQTFHDISFMTTDFVVNQGVMIMVASGALWDVAPSSHERCARSFSRMLMLNAPSAGVTWQPSIVSDVLSVWPTTKGFDQASEGAAGAKLDGDKERILSDVMGETRLKRETALELLEECKWDLPLAGERFASVKAQLPPDAFIY